MEVSRTRNISFGMAWDKAAKKVLATQIAKLPKRKVGQAVELVNKLEQSSVNHTLSINTADRIVMAEGKGGSLNCFAKQYTDRGFISALEDTDKFIARANAKLPEAMKMKEKLLKRMEFLKKRNDYYGIRIDERDIPYFAENLAITNSMQKSPKSAEEIIEQLKRIYDKANGINADIAITATASGAVLNKAGHSYLNKQIVSYNEPVGVQHLDMLEKVVDEEIAYITARDTRISKSMDKPNSKSSKSQKAIIWIGNRIKNSKLGRFFSSIKEKIEDKAFDRRIKKRLLEQEMIEKISDSIEIG